ncbi:MAG: hypothetical protein ACYC6F_17255 [Longimicrobiales bacterium]
MKNAPSVLTPVIHVERDEAGRRVFVGTFEELPGVVCEEATVAAIQSELISAAQSLVSRLGWQGVIIKTPQVTGSTWTIASGAATSEPLTFGYEVLETMESGGWYDLMSHVA